jgi:hypothetical protein
MILITSFIWRMYGLGASERMAAYQGASPAINPPYSRRGRAISSPLTKSALVDSVKQGD